MKSIEDKILSKIYGYGKGCVFSSSDFIKDFSINNIDKALSNLAKQGKIRRIARGLYDFPQYSEFLKQERSADVDQAARAIARKFNWQIEISGESALSLLGLSTQVPATYIYLSSGPNKTYAIQEKMRLEFKKSALKNIGFKYKESSILVQALKALGKEKMTKETIAHLKSRVDSKLYGKILTDTKTATTWIYETIKIICQD
ncbi:MAG: hypothetical protein IBX45_03345 [Campylobacterales bacterium]|nr:hypothetical protein [Campylobacterales bacterium]